jgi:hypothetical protein
MRFLALSALLFPSAAFAQTPVPAAPIFAPVPYLSAQPVRSFKEPGWVIDPAKT